MPQISPVRRGAGLRDPDESRLRRRKRNHCRRRLAGALRDRRAPRRPVHGQLYGRPTGPRPPATEPPALAGLTPPVRRDPVRRWRDLRHYLGSRSDLTYARGPTPRRGQNQEAGTRGRESICTSVTVVAAGQLDLEPHPRLLRRRRVPPAPRAPRDVAGGGLGGCGSRSSFHSAALASSLGTAGLELADASTASCARLAFLRTPRPARGVTNGAPLPNAVAHVARDVRDPLVGVRSHRHHHRRAVVLAFDRSPVRPCSSTLMM